jgi:hypothetical protein
MDTEWPTRLPKPGRWRTERRRLSRSPVGRFVSLRHFDRKPEILADQIGQYFDKTGALCEPAIVRRVGLHCQHALQRAADVDRCGDERQVAFVEAQAVQEARLVAKANDRATAAAFPGSGRADLRRPGSAPAWNSSCSSPCTRCTLRSPASGSTHAEHPPAQMTGDFERAQHFAQAL